MDNIQTIDNDAVMYCKVMDRMKYLLNSINNILTNKTALQNVDYKNDLLALYYRKLLELIGFGSLIFHKSEYSKDYIDYKKHWNARKILLNIEDKINKEFYPRPCYRDNTKSSRGHHHFDFCKTEHLTWELWKINIKQLNEMVHESNPFSTNNNKVDNDKYYRYLYKLIINLLNTHLFTIKGQRVWVCNLQEKDGKSHCYQAEVKN